MASEKNSVEVVEVISSLTPQVWVRAHVVEGGEHWHHGGTDRRKRSTKCDFD